MTAIVLPIPGATAPAPNSTGESPLLDLAEILPAVFGLKHPSPRWFESQVKRGTIPYFKIGRLVRYDPNLVRLALRVNCLVETTKKRSARINSARQGASS